VGNGQEKRIGQDEFGPFTEKDGRVKGKKDVREKKEKRRHDAGNRREKRSNQSITDQ